MKQTIGDKWILWRSQYGLKYIEALVAFPLIFFVLIPLVKLRKQKKVSYGDKKNILLYGAYGNLSVGDDAILESIIENIDLNIFNVSISSYTPSVTSKQYPNIKVIRQGRNLDGLIYMYESLKKTDIMVFGGGGVLETHNNSFMTTIGMMYKFSKVYLAMIMGVKVYCFSVGSNTKPYNKLTEILVKVLLNNVDGISTRDKKSYIFLNKLCPNLKISPNADPALLLKSTEKTLLNDKKGRVTIGINVMPYYKLLNGDISKLELIRKNIAATIDLSINKLNAHFVFIPMVEGDDTNEQDEIIRYIEQVDQITILKPKYSPKELMGIMRGLDVFIGTRLHPNILAFNVNTVILGIAYHDKINSFFSYLNHEDLVVSLFDFNPDALFNKLKYALANNKTIKNDFQVRQGELRKLAVNSFVALKNLK